MPTFDYTCEVCGHQGRAWRKDKPPRFCSNRCRHIGVGPPPREEKWPITQKMHDQICELYQTAVGMNHTPVVREYADKIGYPAWKIARYAQKHGWVAKHPREPNWTPQELQILERRAHCQPEVIQKHLKRAGFHRSVAGIVFKRKRMRMLKNLQGQSATQVAECFGVDVHAVRRWIKRGWLKATRRGTKRTRQQGGDIYYIKDTSIRRFVIEYLPEIDFRKVDKYWIVDLLVSKEHEYGLCGPGGLSPRAEGPGAAP